ncbi:MAG: hypothetical protein HY904_15265 [Deltaproteobacteria bacterium]|nr:hypothetical protein [Deltaproteobacteria bacterium]
MSLRVYALGFLVVTMGLGVIMRWEFVTGWLTGQGADFQNLRHAHSHAGYYGALTMAWWTVVRVDGLAPSSRAVHLYAACAAAATALFAVIGYRVPTIALSTLIALFWLHGGWRHLRAHLPPRWTDTAPWGLALGAVLVPFIGVTAPRDFALARDLAHLFIAILLFTVFIPAAWQGLGLPRRDPTWLHVVLAVGASAFLVFPHVVGPLGVMFPLAFASWCVLALGRGRLSPVMRLIWLSLPISVAVSAPIPALHAYPWRIAGIHLMVLGPVLCSLAQRVLPRPPHPVLAAAYLLLVVLMNASLVFPAVLPGVADTWVTAVLSTLLLGTAVLAVASVTLRFPWSPPPT